MLGILLIYLIGKKFYDLAGNYEKSQWTYAVLGVLSYYIGTFIAGIAIVIFLDLFEITSVDDVDDFVLGLVAIPFGLLSCWGVYHLLIRNWEKKTISNNLDILDIDLIKEEKE